MDSDPAVFCGMWNAKRSVGGFRKFANLSSIFESNNTPGGSKIEGLEWCIVAGDGWLLVERGGPILVAARHPPRQSAELTSWRWAHPLHWNDWPSDQFDSGASGRGGGKSGKGSPLALGPNNINWQCQCPASGGEVRRFIGLWLPGGSVAG